MASYGDTSSAGLAKSGAVAKDETSSLISASKVQGTKVYNRRGDNLGSIYDLMINKRLGNVAYAIMSFGGFLGIGEEYHPLPWKLLNYDMSKGGYVVDLDRDRLMGAPRYGSSQIPAWADPTYTRGIDDYYGVPPYTM